MEKRNRDIDAVKRLADDWSAGWNNGDTGHLLSLFTDEPVLMPHSQPAVFGKDAIRALYDSIFEAYAIQGDGRIVEIEVSGDLGYFWSDYTLTATPRGGGEMVNETGKSIFIVKRQPDNSWKISRLIDNSNQPVSA